MDMKKAASFGLCWIFLIPLCGLGDSVIVPALHRGILSSDSAATYERPLDEGTLRLEGFGAKTLAKPNLGNGRLEVGQGSAVLGTETSATPALPSALASAAAFWVSAEQNVTADENGLVTRWNDVREPDITASAFKYPCATNGLAAHQPTLAADETGLAGKHYLDFGNWGGTLYDNPAAKWLIFSRVLKVRGLFIVFGTQNKIAPGTGSVTLVGISNAAPFAGNQTSLWHSSSITMADKCRNYFDRVNRSGVNLALTDKDYHLIETLPYSATAIETFAKDRTLEYYSGGSRICEAILFTNDVSETERLGVQDYLWRKWLDKPEDTLGTVAVHSGAAAELPGTDVIARIAGHGSVIQTGGNAVVEDIGGEDAFQGSVTLAGGTVSAIGMMPRFAIAEAGQTLTAATGTVVRGEAAAGIAVKDGTGDLRVSRFAGGIEALRVAQGILRLDPEPTDETAPAALPSAAVNDPSFEAFLANNTGDGLYNMTPAGSAAVTKNGWTFDRTAYATGGFLIGIAYDTTGVLMPVGSAPDGHATLYLNCGTATTTFTVPANGFYRLSFKVGRRGSTTVRKFKVVLDGTDFWETYSYEYSFIGYARRLPFLTAGTTHTLSFVSLPASATDFAGVAFIDDIRIDAERLCETEPVSVAITNPSFEKPYYLCIGDGSPVIVNPVDSDNLGWTFKNSGGIARIVRKNFDDGFLPGETPDGLFMAKLGGTGSVSQAVAVLTPGRYRLKFQICGRMDVLGQRTDVLWDGVRLNRTGTDDILWREISVALPDVAEAGDHTLLFQGIVPGRCSQIDDIRIERIGDICENLLANGDFESGYDGWTFANNTGLLTENRAAAWGSLPIRGTNSAYIITNNAFSQTVTVPAAGRYTLRFATHGRNETLEPWPRYYHEFEVLFGGQRIGIIRNGRGETTRKAEFHVTPPAAGEYEVAFRGISCSFPEVSFIDDVSLTAEAASGTEDLTGCFPKTSVIDVAEGAKLALDFEGTLPLKTVRYAGKTVGGTLNAATHPEFIIGRGTIFSPSKGVLLTIH
jgi:hypothetical protein